MDLVIIHQAITEHMSTIVAEVVVIQEVSLPSAVVAAVSSYYSHSLDAFVFLVRKEGTVATIT
jgi:hypothetical protein